MPIRTKLLLAMMVPLGLLIAQIVSVNVFIRELQETSPIPGELFVKRYGVSEAECRVLMMLTQGMTPQEAARALGISLATARTHIARLLEKTGTARQPDLMRLAMRALAPAARP